MVVVCEEELRGRLEEGFSKESNLVKSRREGLGLFYKLAGLGILLHMSRYPSMRLPLPYNSICSSVARLDYMIALMNRSTFHLDSNTLGELLLFKRKYLFYSSFLAAISTFPLLHKVAGEKDLNEAIFAKCSSILAIKILDNLNDEFHSQEQAYISLDTHLKAFTQDVFVPNSARDLISRAENSAYTMTRWTYESLGRYVPEGSPMFKLYRGDLYQYIEGQKDSFLQKVTDENIPLLTLKEYLDRVSEKSIGKIWLDMDLCVFEGCSGGEIEPRLLEVFAHIHRGLDLVHKSAQLYDDISDLRGDLEQRILNGVVFYALDHGALRSTDVLKPPQVIIEKLEVSPIPNQAMRLGDAIFKESLRCFYAAGRLSEGVIDVDALIYSVHVLRLFAVRKWFLQRLKRDLSFLLSTPLRSIVTPLITGNRSAYPKPRGG